MSKPDYKTRKEYYQNYYSREDVKERRKQYLKDYYQKNKEKLIKYKSDYYFKNKERVREDRVEYRKKNRKSAAARSAKYKARRKKKLGKIGGMFKDEIAKIYAKAEKGQQVDHIIPMCGENVTGLHVPWNLQILSAEENNSKNNRIDLKLESEKQLAISLKIVPIPQAFHRTGEPIYHPTPGDNRS